MDLDKLISQILELLQRDKRVSYRMLKRRFDLDDEYIEDLKDELIEAKQLAQDENGKVLVWTGEPMSTSSPTPVTEHPSAPAREPFSYTPPYLVEKILTSRSALEGERKQVTFLFADIKDSTELIRDLDPEDAQKLLDPAIHLMMNAVHQLSSSTLRLVEGLVQVNDLGPIPVKGMDEPVDIFELTGASTVRRRLQAAVSRGLTKFVGRDTEIDALHQALERAYHGHVQIVAAVEGR